MSVSDQTRGIGAAEVLEGLDEPDRTRALTALRAMIAAHDTGHGRTYDSAAWIMDHHHHVFASGGEP
jgi:hypothetical protein